MPAEGIKIEKHFCKNLGQYFTDGFGSDGSVVKGLNGKIYEIKEFCTSTLLHCKLQGKFCSCLRIQNAEVMNC